MAAIGRRWRGGIAALGGLVAILLSFLFLVQDGDSAVGPSVTGELPKERPADVVSGRMEIDSTPRAAIPHTAVRLRIVDEQAAAIQGATFGARSVLGADLGVGDALPVFVGNALGEIEMRPDQVDDLVGRDVVFEIAHPDFVAVLVSRPTVSAWRNSVFGSVIDITLTRGLEQIFEFVDPNGAPVANQVALLSRVGALAVSGVAAATSPTFDRSLAMTPVSGADGRATARVNPGEYWITVRAERQWGVARLSVRSPTVLPQAPIRFGLDRIWAVALVVEGDEVVTGNASFDNLSFSNGATQQLADLTKELKRRSEASHPKATTVFCWTGFARGSAVPAVHSSIFLAHHGWRERVVNLAPLDAELATEILRLPDAEPSTPVARVILEWGSTVPPPKLQFRSGEPRGDAPSFLIEAVIGRESSVPAGVVSVISQFDAEAALLSKLTIDAAVGETHRALVTPLRDTAICRMHLTTEGGWSVRQSFVALRVAGEQCWTRPVFSADPVALLVPAGHFTLEATAHGFERFTIPVDFPPGTETAVEVILRPAVR